MAVPLSNTFEGGSDGTTITTGNSGGASGNAFNTVTIGTGYTVTYENSPVVSEALCGVITPGATSAVSLLDWTSASVGTIGPTVYTRFYVLWPTAIPFGASNDRLLKLRSGTTHRAAIVVFGSAAAGKFTWSDSTDSGGTNSTMTLEAGIVYRFETKFTLSTTVGQIEIRVYAGDSLGPLEILSSAANLNLGATTIDDIQIGYVTAGSNTSYGVMALDGLAIGTTDWWGPVTQPTGPQFDVATESVRTLLDDPMTWTHTPVGTPRGIVVAVVHGTSATDHVVGVTYGGDAMTRVVRATDTVTEPGAAELWFLGTSIPTGPQTVSVDLAIATTDDIHGISWSLTASADLEVIDFDSISEDAANPTVALSKGGRQGWSVAAMYGGGAAPGGTLSAGNTLSHTHDLGAFYSQSAQETAPDVADHTIGWSTLASDDLAFVALCVAEVLTVASLIYSPRPMIRNI